MTLEKVHHSATTHAAAGRHHASRCDGTALFRLDDADGAETERRQELLKIDSFGASMFEEIVGSCEPIRQVLRQVGQVAPSDSTVLVLGETGTGKELIARAVHRRSNRSGSLSSALTAAPFLNR